jgi:hypothetical protein
MRVMAGGYDYSQWLVSEAAVFVQLRKKALALSPQATRDRDTWLQKQLGFGAVDASANRQAAAIEIAARKNPRLPA